MDEEIISEIATEAVSQALTLKKANPDYTILVLTPRPASVFIKDAKKAGVETRFMGFSPTSSINLLALLGDSAKGLMGALPWSQWHEMKVPGIQKLWEYNKKYHPNRNALDIYYICGWLYGMVFEEAAKRAEANLTGEGIKNALETLNNFETEGIAPPITFSKTDHRGSYMLKIGLANPEKGTFEPVTNWIGVEK